MMFTEAEIENQQLIEEILELQRKLDSMKGIKGNAKEKVLLKIENKKLKAQNLKLIRALRTMKSKLEKKHE